MKLIEVYLKENKVKLRDKENKERKFYSEFKDLFNKRNKLQSQLSQRETMLAREEERVNSLNSRFNTFSIEKVLNLLLRELTLSSSLASIVSLWLNWLCSLFLLLNKSLNSE